MKKSVISLGLLLLVLLVSAQRYSDSTWVIGVGHIGKITINMNEQKLNKIFSSEQIKKENTSDNGDSYALISISLKGDTKTAFELETMCIDICIVSRVSLYSDKYKTVKGVGIGSTVADLKKNYNLLTVKGSEKGFMIFVDELPQTAFVVKVPGLRAVDEKSYKITEIPDATKIESVYMY
jgi:hypothetical protein